jgi:hypothetical protein
VRPEADPGNTGIHGIGDGRAQQRLTHSAPPVIGQDGKSRQMARSRHDISRSIVGACREAECNPDELLTVGGPEDASALLPCPFAQIVWVVGEHGRLVRGTPDGEGFVQAR